MLAVAGCGRARAPGPYWVDRVERVEAFNDDTVVAVASRGRNLYVSTGDRLLTAGLDGGAPADVTAKLDKRPEDKVTDLLVDAMRGDLWVVLNGNTDLARCYGEDLGVRQCPHAWIDQRSSLQEKLQQKIQQPSINAMAQDGVQAIVGLFRGGVYLYSFERGTLDLAYRPADPDAWPITVALTDRLGLAAVCGDGLVAVDRQTGRAERFPDRTGFSIRSVATHGDDIFIGAIGLYRGRITAFMPAR